MPYIRAAVTDESYESFQRLARKYGITISSLIEAIGLRFIELEPEPESFEFIIEAARQVDSDRRRRGHR